MPDTIFDSDIDEFWEHTFSDNALSRASVFPDLPGVTCVELLTDDNRVAGDYYLNRDDTLTTRAQLGTADVLPRGAVAFPPGEVRVIVTQFWTNCPAPAAVTGMPYGYVAGSPYAIIWEVHGQPYGGSGGLSPPTAIFLKAGSSSGKLVLRAAHGRWEYTEIDRSRTYTLIQRLKANSYPGAGDGYEEVYLAPAGEPVEQIVAHHTYEAIEAGNNDSSSEGNRLICMNYHRAYMGGGWDGEHSVRMKLRVYDGADVPTGSTDAERLAGIRTVDPYSIGEDPPPGDPPPPVDPLPDDPPLTYPAGTPACFEVRIVPLLEGVPGAAEGDGEDTIREIPLADTLLVEQFADVTVTHPLNEGRTAQVTLSMHDPVVTHLAPFQQAVWIGYLRPGASVAECVFFGQCNVLEDFAGETVTLDAQDPTIRCQHHYIRRGDLALNVDKHRGRLLPVPSSVQMILTAAYNTIEQQARAVPALGMRVESRFYRDEDLQFSLIEFERGQEVWDLLQQFTRAVGGPDMDVTPEPAWEFPVSLYAYLALYDAPTDPEDPFPSELGRNLDPADPNAPAAGEVIFEYGIGEDNMIDLDVSPGRPTTHVHVLDANARYRETSADAEGSEATGIFVDWIASDIKVKSKSWLPGSGAFTVSAGPHFTTPDTSVLQLLGEARIRAYGRPPKFLTVKLRPDDAQTRHYGAPGWADAVTGDDPSGDWYIGDYVRVRGQRGLRTFSTLARITEVKLRQEATNGLLFFEVTLIPAVGGTAGTDAEDAT